jgi:cytochrome P450
VSFLGAGTYPTAATLIFTAFYIMAKPEIEERLRKELKDVMANFDDEVSQLLSHFFVKRNLSSSTRVLILTRDI